MNDYSRGIADTLIWVLRTWRKCKGKPEEFERKVQGTFDRIMAGSALDFGERINLLPED